MRTKLPTRTGLATGLVVLALVAACFVVLVVSGRFVVQSHQNPLPDAYYPSLSQTLDDPATATYLALLARRAPQTALRLEAEAAAAIREGANRDALASLILHATLFEFQRQAHLLRFAPTADYDGLLTHIQDGFVTLAAAKSPWCEAREISNLMQSTSSDLVDRVLVEFTYDSAAYYWALDWGTIILSAAAHAEMQPARRLPLSAYDKSVLQQQGLALGSKQWALALKIAAFSQSEGQGYRPMQDVIDSLDICELAIVAVDLSSHIPIQNRGRIWADLLPEIFAANTPYVFARITDYFFLSS